MGDENLQQVPEAPQERKREIVKKLVKSKRGEIKERVKEKLSRSKKVAPELPVTQMPAIPPRMPATPPQMPVTTPVPQIQVPPAPVAPTASQPPIIGQSPEIKEKLQTMATKMPEPNQDEMGYEANLLNEARKYDRKELFVIRQLQQEQENFRDSHAAPSSDPTPVEERMQDGGDFSLAEVAKGQHIQPKDYFDPVVGPRYYLYNNPEGKESLAALQKAFAGIRNNKPTKITAYRSVPKSVNVDKLQNGDWVTFSKQYAVNHAKARFGGKYKIVKQEVDPNQVWWDGNDINEWGYDDGGEMVGKSVIDRERELMKIWDEANKK